MGGMTDSSVSVAAGRKFDWLPRFDPRSRSFPLQAEPGSSVEITSKYWKTGIQLDQGAEGACVGHAIVQAMETSPIRADLPEPQASAFGWYELAQYLDHWEGENYSGTSVLAGAKTAVKAGLVSEYRWCFGIQDVLTALMSGPVVIGCAWKDSMLYPGPGGLIDITGKNVGGHAVVATGVGLDRHFVGQGRLDVIRIKQSWGRGHGANGSVYLRVEDLRVLLEVQGGEACVLTQYEG